MRRPRRPRRPRKLARWQARRTEALINAAIVDLGYRDTAVRLSARSFLGRSASTIRQHVAIVRHGLPRPVESGAWERVARWVNRRLTRPGGGLPISDGTIQCPRCHRWVPTAADPQEWARRRDHHGWEVLSCWGGTAECCGHLLVFQPDGRAEAYEL